MFACGGQVGLVYHMTTITFDTHKFVKDLESAGVIHYKLPVHKKSLFSLIYSIRQLVKIVKLEEIDLIHARSRVPALAAFFVSRKTQIPFVTTCHGFYKNHFLM